MSRDEIKELTGEDPIDMFGECGFKELQEDYEVAHQGRSYEEEHRNDGRLIKDFN